MIKIETTHNGKTYRHFKDALASAIMSGYEKIVSKRLEPFAQEIANSGGTVTIDFTGDDFKANVYFKNFPEDLAQKLKKAVTAE